MLFKIISSETWRKRTTRKSRRMPKVLLKESQ
jgi:hypothetical protein